MVHRSHLPVATAAAVALVVLSVGCSAQDAAACPEKTVVSDFNAQSYMGTWYEYAKMGRMPFEAGGICITAEYSLSNDNITVVNNMKDNTTMENRTTTGWAEFAGDHSQAKLNVHFPNSTVAGNYWVLSTDYDNFSIVWSCFKRPDMPTPTEISWILLRSRNQSDMTMEKVEEELKALGLPKLGEYSRTEQSAQLCAGAAHVLGAVLSIAMASLFALLH